MIAAIQRRLAARSEGERQGGFTLIELMVVVMIIAILVGIAIPAFLGARKRAQDTGAKSNLRNALATAQTVFSSNQTYDTTANLITELTADEPSFTFENDTTAAGSPKVISLETIQTVAGGTHDELVLATKSDSNKCFFLRHIATAGVVNTAGDSISGTFMVDTAVPAGGCTAGGAPDHDGAWTAV